MSETGCGMICELCEENEATVEVGSGAVCPGCHDEFYGGVPDRQKSVWQLLDEYADRSPDGQLYLRPSLEGIKEHVPWLAERDQWIVWAWDGPQKKPHRGASPTTKTDWQVPGTQVSLEEAWAAYEEYDMSGVGFVFTGEEDEILEDFDDTIDPVTNSVDDDCLEDALTNDDEKAFYSSSATGAHRYPVAEDATGTDRHPHEVYADGRFAAITGHAINPESGSHGEDMSERVNHLSEKYNQRSGTGADVGTVEFDSDPVRLDDGRGWQPPEELAGAPACVLPIVKALSTEHPDGVGWGQNTFGRYSYLLMLLAAFDSDEETMARLASSFYCPMIAETQRGNHFKKPAQDAPHGLGVPWDLEEQVQYIARKVREGDLTPPSVETIEEKCNVVIGHCGCPVHGDEDRVAGIRRVRSEVRSTSGQEKRDNMVLLRTMSNVAREIGSSIEGAKVYHSPQGTQKTVQAAAGAADHPRLLIGGNKREYRETVQWAADRHGVSVREVVPFSEHWLASDESPVRDDVRGLIAQDVEPRYIKQKFGHLVPDGHVDPFDEQFDGPITEDLLIGSPGHENVEAFRSIEFDDGAVRRDVVLDDVSPVDQLDENAFTLDSASNELNQLIRFIPELESRGITELLRNRDDLERVKHIARGVPGEGEDELVFEAGDDIWGALDAATGEAGEAIVVDIVEAVLQNEDVTGKSVHRLKAACGVEQRGVTTVRWNDDRGRSVISWVSSPYLSDHDVALLGATHEPGVTDQWFRDIGHGAPEHEDLCPDWRAARRAQGYLVIQLSDIRNSRSGLKKESRWYGEDDLAYKAGRARAWTDAIEVAEGERPWVVDSYGMKRYYEENDVLEAGDEVIHYGRERSNNRAMHKDVGFVPGPTYYGDQWIGLRAAYAGERAEVVHPEGKGERAYCETDLGQELMVFQVQAAMDQAIGRFGRDTDNETRVYVDSDEIPGGWPTVDATEHVVHYTESERKAHEALVNGAETLEEVAEAVGVTRQQAGNLARSLAAKDVASIEEYALENGRHRISENSDILLNTYELSEIPRSAPFSRAGAELEAGAPRTVPVGLGGRSPGARETARGRRDGPPPDPGEQAALERWVG